MSVSESPELHRRQRAFRQVLDAFSRPGTVQVVELEPQKVSRPAALDGALEALVRVFVDQAVSFAVADSEADNLERYLASETHAVRRTLGEAGFVVVPARADTALVNRAVREACAGTLVSPEKGATVFLGCARVAETCDVSEGCENLQVVAVRGPGVRTVNRFVVDRVTWADARALRGDEFPCGIELVLVDAAGSFVALPRTSQVVVEGALCEMGTSAQCAAGVGEVL